MSTFTNPLDPTRRLRSGCSCGRHASEAEHERAIGLEVQQAAAADAD